VLQERRKTLHERIAVAIETLYKEQLDDYLPDLARHYSSSGNVAKAVSYLHLAGRQAANRSAHAEAFDYYQRGLEFLNNGGDARERARGELPLQMGFAASLRATRGSSRRRSSAST
jgi:predicted ATPase